MIRVGLTGGIGAGKSTVARAFSHRGAYLIDADVIAREVVAPGTEGLDELVAEFGQDILGPDGALDRAALAAKAFVDEDSRQRLNAITHPRVGARTWELMQAAPHDAILVQDIPLLVEGGMAPHFHLVVIVWADEQTRLQRLTDQRGMPADDAAARIRAQADDGRRRAVADVWLDNSGSPDAVADAAGTLWDERLVPFEANVRAGVAATPSGPVPSGPEADGIADRTVNRLRAVTGDRARSVDRDTSGDGIVIRVTVADDESAAGLVNPLTEAGFPRVDGDGQVHGCADPGRPVTVRVVTAD